MSLGLRNLELISNPWMTETETLWLIERAKQSKVFVEVGCWTGITTRNIATHAPETQIFAVDHFQGSPEHLDPASGNYVAFLKNPHWLIAEARRNVEGLKVQIIPFDSHRAARLLPERSADTVFIDASHDYEHVKADIEAWLPVVRSGGILCGHDYDYGWQGVVRAVNESFLEAERVPGTSIWEYRVTHG